ncbi:MAG: hypothetical protein KA250_06620 [Verrucomicrobiales bacterium]|jgi:hypothetical protein|nr:hypothetical protein [Verrucomicrobiales bacterium]MBP9225463.1 hypothetical protein [Verrucomicrobiales bacterium]HQZ26718.1 hypothetical protein [Verrucomicrobiales bacterium]
MAASITSGGQDERGKVFHWEREKRVWLYFSAFLLFSLMIHGSGFYLFKVVYPSPNRMGRKPDSIRILDPSNAAVRSVLQRISDRTIYLLPPSAQSSVRGNLDLIRVRYTPAFQRTEPELLPPLSAASLTGIPEPEGPLPPPEYGNAKIHSKLSPSLVTRAVAPWSIMDDYLGTAPSLPLFRVNLDVAPDGSVKVTGVDATLEEAEKSELAAIIESTLRFVPGVDAVSGWMEIGGKE